MFKTSIFILLLTSFFLVLSCGGDDNNNNNNNNNNDSRFLWKYELKNQPTNELNEVPAIDENGNLYFGTNETLDLDKKGKFTVVSLDKDGKLRWEKVINNAKGYTKIAYNNNKVFFLTGINTYKLKDGTIAPATTYALDASNGNEIWKIEENGWTFTWPQFVVTDKKVYVYIDSSEDTISKVISYDVNTGDKKGFLLIANDSGRSDGTIIRAMTAVNDKIYALLLIGTNKASVTQIIDSGEMLENGWRYNYDSTIQTDNDTWVHLYSKDLPIDDNGNIYFTTSFKDGNDARETIVSISKDGQFNWISKLLTTPEGMITSNGMTIDKLGNIYAKFLNKLYSVDPSGTQLWSVDKTYYDEYEILDSNFQTQPSIAKNGNSYHHNNYGFMSLKKDGKINWKYQLENENIDVATYSTIAPNGNIIIMGSKYIICIKGDDSSLETSNWPKVYGNAGNTSSK